MEKTQQKTIIGIRKEDKSIWERRVALTPQEVKTILSKNSDIEFIVEPSNIRVFANKEYEKAGAIV